MIVDEKPNAYMAWNIAFGIGAYALFCFYVHLLTGLKFNAGIPFVFAKAAHWELPAWFVYGIVGALCFAALGMIFNPWAVKDVYGGAHLATKDEIKSLGLRCKEGLVLGRTVHIIMGFYHRCSYLRMDKPLSVLCFAPPGSGKTAGLIVPSLLAVNHSVIVMDPKGEIFKITARHRFNAFGSQVIRFEPGAPGSARWNPLSRKELPKTLEETHTYIGRLAEALIIPDKAGEEDMWTRDARALFRFWALFLIWRDSTEGDVEGETSLARIVAEAMGARCKGDSEQEQRSKAQLALAQAFDEYGGDPSKGAMPLVIQNEGISFVGMADKQFDGVFGTFKSKVDLFNNPTVADNVSTSDFCFKDLREKITSVYFVVAIKDMKYLRPLISLFFEVATDVFLGQVPKPQDKNVTFFLDEFVQMGKMPRVLSLPATGRGYRFNAVYIIQSFNQLVAIYGKYDADALKNTTSFLVVFAQNEPDVAKSLSESIGKYTRVKTTRSTNAGAILRRDSDSEEGIPLVKPQDIMSLPEGQILVLVQAHYETPIKAEAAFHFDDRTLSKFVEGQAAMLRPDKVLDEDEERFDDGSRNVEAYKTDWQRDPNAQKPADYMEDEEKPAGSSPEQAFEDEILDMAADFDGSDMSALNPMNQVDVFAVDEEPFQIPKSKHVAAEVNKETAARVEPPPQAAAAPRLDGEKEDDGIDALYAQIRAFSEGNFDNLDMHVMADDDPGDATEEDAA